MKLLVDRLTESPAPHEFEVGEAWWRGHAPQDGGMPEAPAGPIHVHARAWKQGEDILLAVDRHLAAVERLQATTELLGRVQALLEQGEALIDPPSGRRHPAQDPERQGSLAGAIVRGLGDRERLACRLDGPLGVAGDQPEPGEMGKRPRTRPRRWTFSTPTRQIRWEMAGRSERRRSET